MGTFRQLGDPVCPDCLCQHHEKAYAEWTPPANLHTDDLYYELLDVDATVVEVAITTTETCCVVVNAAAITKNSYAATDFEIERPKGTIRTTQEDQVSSNLLKLIHHAAWEVLPAGTYTYYLVNRSVGTRRIMAAWIKAVASDCLG
jgi:hypothetical protein